MEDTVDEANGGRLVGVLIGEFDMDFPLAASEGSLIGALETDHKFLHVVVDECHLIVAHHELHDICLYPAFWAAHLDSHHTRRC
jgi:hypothetical protein